MALFMNEILKATQLTRRGRLADATRVILRALRLGGARRAQSQARDTAAPVPESSVSARVASKDVGVSGTPFQDIQAPATFSEHVFKFTDAAYAYRLYIPGASDAAAPSPMPLVVLLHGCKQDAADFAQGTAMNALAEQKKCIVLYPEQLSEANTLRCWNWFEPAHQARGAGEPGMIAALTRQVLARHNADPARVYIAGLSAGGAMAAVVAERYPELFAAVGVHSGIPTGAASSVVSAFSAMRRGTRQAALADAESRAKPTIVFHGSADKTVHPENGDQIADAALAALGASGLALEKIQRTEESVASTGCSRSVLRTIYSAADGKSWVENWSVASGPHAWSGGSAAGSFTDPQGPDASLAMLEFFLQHRQ